MVIYLHRLDIEIGRHVCLQYKRPHKIRVLHCTMTSVKYLGMFKLRCYSMTSIFVVYNLLSLYVYSVMQSDRNSTKTDTFHKPITYKRHVQTNNEQKTTFARHEYGRVGVFRIKISSLLPKLQPLEKCQFSNCSHLIASHCI